MEQSELLHGEIPQVAAAFCQNWLHSSTVGNQSRGSRGLVSKSVSIEFITNTENGVFEYSKNMRKTLYGLVADESRGVKRKHEDEEGDDDAAAQ